MSFVIFNLVIFNNVYVLFTNFFQIFFIEIPLNVGGCIFIIKINSIVTHFVIKNLCIKNGVIINEKLDC